MGRSLRRGHYVDRLVGIAAKEKEEPAARKLAAAKAAVESEAPGAA